jgi:dipeptidyl aminopeptidase/acylaminoacyl peptidase
MSRVRASDFHDIDGVSEPRLSPDGETVAFVRTTPDDGESYEATVHVVPADGSGEPSAFTVREGVDSAPRWSPSGDRLAFVSTRGGDDDRPQLWLLPVDGGEARRVTDVPGGVSDPSWSPDGDRLAFLQSTTAAEREAGDDRAVPDAEYERETPDPRVVDRTVYRTAQQYHDGARSHAYVVDVESESVERVTDGDVDRESLSWGDAETLYVAAKDVGDDPDDSEHYAIVAHDVVEGGADRLHETAGRDPRLAATDDGRVAHVHVPADRQTIRQSELRVYDADTGDVHRVSEDLDRTLDRAVRPQWGPDGTDLLFATPDEGKTSLWRAPGDGSAAPERVVRPGHVDGAHVGDGAVALTMSEWDHPGDVFVRDGLDPAGDRDGVRRLTEVNADYLDGREVAEPEALRFDSERGPVHGWLLMPPGFDPEGTYPLAVEIHGGPHAMWSTAGTMWHEFQTLAARGYAVFWSNPRGSAGYGREYMQAIDRDWGDATLTDVMAGVETVAEREYVDAENAFVTGGSFGGFMAAWTVGRTGFFRAAVAQRGVYDLTGFYGSTDWAYKLVEGDFDATPTEEPGFLWEQSPAAHAESVATPTLLIHSDDDYRTPACSAELYHRLLRTNGVDTRLVRYPREGHELSRSGEPAHRVDRIERIVRWFDGYSEHSDAPPALERDRNDGLSAGECED